MPGLGSCLPLPPRSGRLASVLASQWWAGTAQVTGGHLGRSTAIQALRLRTRVPEELQWCRALQGALWLRTSHVATLHVHQPCCPSGPSLSRGQAPCSCGLGSARLLHTQASPPWTWRALAHGPAGAASHFCPYFKIAPSKLKIVHPCGQEPVPSGRQFANQF